MATVTASLRIVSLDGATLNPGDNPWTGLEELGELILYPDSEPHEVVGRLQGATVAVTNKVRLTRAALAALPDLRMIAVTGTGYDCVDVVAARERGIPVCNVPGYGTDSVAQFTFALLLELCHHVGRHNDAVHAGLWQSCGSFSFSLTPQIELAGLTLGIVGYGRIGQRVSAIARAFGMPVLTASRHSLPESTLPPGIQPVPLDELVARADVLSLHCSLNDSSRGLINAARLDRMKPSALLLNASRGGLIDEPALAAALNADRLAGAALDVASVEPILPSNPLLTAKNCLLTPHMAWSTLAARRRMMQTVVRNIRQWQAGQPENVV